MYEAIFQHVIMPVCDIFRGTRMIDTYREFLQTQYWSRDRLSDLQDQKLRALIRHAYETVPYYRSVFDKHGLKPQDVQSVSDLHKVPALTKVHVRTFSAELRSKTPIRPVYRNHTGGSTGEPLHFLLDGSEKSAAWAGMMRGFEWAGVKPGEKTCFLVGGTLGLHSGIRGRIFNRVLNRLPLPAFELSASTVTEFARKIRQCRPALIQGYASTVYLFARLCREAGIGDVSFRSVVTTAEVLNPVHRKAIEDQFGCPVFDLYGCAEVNSVAFQCERRDGYHVTDEKLILETVSSDQAPIQEIAITNLTNYVMPFIRYRNGDSVEFTDTPCGCGRHLSRIGAVHGRVFDFIRTSDGTYLAGEFFPHLFRNFTAFDYFQVIQESERNIRVLLVKSPAFNESELTVLRSKLAEYLGGGMQIDYEFSERIPLTAAGKLRVTVSKIL